MPLKGVTCNREERRDRSPAPWLSSVSAPRATAQRSTSTRPRCSSRRQAVGAEAPRAVRLALRRDRRLAAGCRSSSAPACSRPIEMVEAGPGRPHRRRLLRPAGAVAEGAARGDRAGREGRWRDLRAGPRQTDQRDRRHAAVDEHDGRGVPVLRRGDRREGDGRSGARGGARVCCRTRGSCPGTCAARTACWSVVPERRRSCARYSSAATGAPRSSRCRRSCRERDRALGLRCGVDVALADVPRRDPFRRAAQPAALTSRSSRIAPCSSGCSGGRSRAGAKPSPSGCWRGSVCCAAGRAPRGW